MSETELEEFLAALKARAVELAGDSKVHYCVLAMIEIGRHDGKLELAAGLKSNMPKMEDHIERLREFLNAMGTIHSGRVSVGSAGQKKAK